MPGRLSQGKTPALISLDALELSEGVGWLGRLKTQGPWLVLVHKSVPEATVNSAPSSWPEIRCRSSRRGQYESRMGDVMSHQCLPPWPFLPGVSPSYPQGL